MNNTLSTVLLLALVLLSACQPSVPKEVQMAYQQLPEKIDFNYHIKPILSDKCFACHGPDAANQKADLRLDTPEGAYGPLGEKGNRAAIVAGKLKKSEVFWRIISDDENLAMPPPESHLMLSDQEKALLIKWIEEGAEYKPHWAFIPPAYSEPPATQGKADHPIDLFILKRLEQEGLTFAPKAAKETLIRRLSFDLTGLPPSLEEIDAFVNDPAPDAYEKLIERLLASPSYGERMANNWMDVARYADSDGYLDDKHRNFSPWRDWVIKAFNENMPYDQFATWQLAGDLLEQPTQESILATAFNRLNKRNSEAGIVFEEYRVEYAADRTHTLGTAFLGLSVECARCHDHKYDPISQKNYYELFGFFNSTFEIGTAVYGPGQTPGPALLLTDSLEQIQIDSIRAFILHLEDKLDNYVTNINQKEVLPSLDAATLARNLQKSLVAHYPFDQFKTQNELIYLSPEQNNRAETARAISPIIKDGVTGKGLFVSDYNSITLGKDVGWFERTDPFSIQLWLYPDTIYPEANVLWHCEELRLGQKGYTLGLEDNQLKFVIAHSWPQNAIQVKTKTVLPVKEWSKVSVTYDGSSQAKGVQIYINGQPQSLEIVFDNLYRSILFEPNIHTYGFKGLTLGARDKYIPFKNGGLDEVKVYNRNLTPLEILYTYDPKKAIEQIEQGNAAEIKRYYTQILDPKFKAFTTKIQEARNFENDLLTTIPEIMVMGDLPEPRPTHILERGVYDVHGAEVSPGTLELIFPFDPQLPRNRLGLTKWLFDPAHPLTARVMVNRIWQMHFGRGLVETAEDFGNQGQLPSHPELLDWLALEFVKSGWDIKAMHRLMVSSETYQQTSAITEALLEKDPENKLLARGPRFRLPAEMIRDNALVISDLLVDQVGGPSVYPYQPAGLWDGLTNKGWAYKYLQEPGDGLYRRSLYTIWKRTAPPPSLLIFDASDRAVCTVRRSTTSTPLQALVLLNDPQYVEAARKLAEKLIREEDAISERLTKAFRLSTGRAPDPEEQKILTSFYQDEISRFQEDSEAALAFIATGDSNWDQNLNPNEIAALGIVVNGIMNTDEAYTRK